MMNGKVKTVKRRTRISRLEIKEAIHGYLFLVPTVVLFVIFSFVTVIMGFVYSFTDMAPGNPDSYNWTLANFEYIFKDTVYLHSILNVLVYCLMSVPMSIVTSLLVAALLNRKLRGIKVFRILYYLPAVTSGIATAFIWRSLYSDNGLLNTIITQWFGASEGLDWVSTQSYFAMFCIALVTTWGGLGGNMLIYLAGMQSISPELYEAAKLDGANGFQRLMKITVPLLRPTTYFVLTMGIIGAFQLFDIVAMIGGSGNYFTQTPVTQIEASFRHGEGGMASAQSVVLFIVIMVVTFLTQSMVKERKK